MKATVNAKFTDLLREREGCTPAKWHSRSSRQKTKNRSYRELRFVFIDLSLSKRSFPLLGESDTRSVLGTIIRDVRGCTLSVGRKVLFVRLSVYCVRPVPMATLRSFGLMLAVNSRVPFRNYICSIGFKESSLLLTNNNLSVALRVVSRWLRLRPFLRESTLGMSPTTAVYLRSDPSWKEAVNGRAIR